jgi:hypothetical protein
VKAKKTEEGHFQLEISGDEFRLVVSAFRELCFGASFNPALFARIGFSMDRATAIARELGPETDGSGLEL